MEMDWKIRTVVLTRRSSYYKKLAGNGVVFIAVVVDDIIAAATHLQTLRWLADCLRATYKITELGEPAYLVGLSISRDHSAITVHQNQFVRDLAATFKQTKCNAVPTPAVPGDVTSGQSPQLPPGHLYLSLIGSLLWCTISRPDIAVAVAIACSKSIRPTEADWKAALRILRYLLHTPDVVLAFTVQAASCPAICTYVDAAWANAPKSRSRYGYIVCVFGNPVMWEAKVTTMVCLSTAEAEYYAAVHAAKSVLWLASLVAEITASPVPTAIIYEDNAACIRMATNPIVSARNRHFSMRMW